MRCLKRSSFPQCIPACLEIEFEFNKYSEKLSSPKCKNKDASFEALAKNAIKPQEGRPTSRGLERVRGRLMLNLKEEQKSSLYFFLFGLAISIEISSSSEILSSVS